MRRRSKNDWFRETEESEPVNCLLVILDREAPPEAVMFSYYPVMHLVVGEGALERLKRNVDAFMSELVPSWLKWGPLQSLAKYRVAKVSLSREQIEGSIVR